VYTNIALMNFVNFSGGSSVHAHAWYWSSFRARGPVRAMLGPILQKVYVLSGASSLRHFKRLKHACLGRCSGDFRWHGDVLPVACCCSTSGDLFAGYSLAKHATKRLLQVMNFRTARRVLVRMSGFQLTRCVFLPPLGAVLHSFLRTTTEGWPVVRDVNRAA
jgi:hypothetical protein